jgi:pyrimidine-specific ribonucleoside hydrolase
LVLVAVTNLTGRRYIPDMTELILDVDTGVDDALAILFAVRHPDLRLRAITCVAGNTDVDQVVINTLRVLDAAGAPDVPVARGASTPLLATLRHARHVHGDDGMGDLGLPDSTRAPVAEHAVELLRKEILASPEPVTLVTLAPLTNIALLLRMYPEVAGRIGRIMTMGGSASVGNASPVAEFNVWHDPEATAIVFGAGLPLTMYGLDVFYGVALPRASAEELAGSAEPGARLAGRLLLHASDRYGHEHRLGEPGGAGLGDAGAVCAVADPGGLTTRRLPVSVELAGALTRGQTVVDHRSVAGEDAEHGLLQGQQFVDVALGVDGQRLRKLYLSTVLGQ